MTRATRAANRAAVYRVTDAAPEQAVLPVLHEHLGESVVLVVYRRGRVQTHGQIQSGRFIGEEFSLRHQYDVPATPAALNRAFSRGREQDGWYYHWKTGSDDEFKYHLKPGDEIRVFPASRVRPVRHLQRHARGVTHCVFQPMIKWAAEKATIKQSEMSQHAIGTAKHKSCRTKRNEFKKFVEVCTSLADEYKPGVPEDHFQSVVDRLPLPVHLTVRLPFVRGATTIDVRTTNKKTNPNAFHFTNTRIDHVDLSTDTSRAHVDAEEKRHFDRLLDESNEATLDRAPDEDGEAYTREQMQQLMQELLASKTFFTFKGGYKCGVRVISTLHKTYRLDSKYNRTVRGFEKDAGIDAMKICAIKQSLLTQFVQRGYHHNNTGVRCNGALPQELQLMVDAEHELRRLKETKEDKEDSWLDGEVPSDAQIEAAKRAVALAREAADQQFLCLDIKKSYASFHKCHLYEQEKFPSKFTDMATTDRLSHLGSLPGERFRHARPGDRRGRSQVGREWRTLCSRRSIWHSAHDRDWDAGWGGHRRGPGHRAR